MHIRTKRIYDPPSQNDGLRVLVDRLWPRGVKKDDARVDLWAKELAPKRELRRWFTHDESRFAEFRERYIRELDDKHDAIRALVERADGRTVTLLFAARDRLHNNAVVLQELLSTL